VNAVRQFCVDTLELLTTCSKDVWAKTFVDRRMEFARTFANDLTFSTSHGVDFFTNVIACLDGEMEWDEKGHLGDNFRKLIKRNL